MSDASRHRRLLLGGAVLAVLAAISWMAMREIRVRRERRGAELAARICGS